jgi:hypothetical protein
MLDKAFDQLGDARSIDTGCSHDFGLAEAAIRSHGLKHRELAWCEVCFWRQMAHECCIGDLAGPVQQVKVVDSELVAFGIDRRRNV